MQVLNVEGFEKRVLYNAAKAYSMQLHKAEAFAGLEPIIALTVTDFVMFEDIKPVITYFRLLEKETLIKYSDDIELIFIELPKFAKTEDQLKTVTDKWIYFIKNAGSLEYVPESLAETPIDRAFRIANTAGLSEEELEIQHRRRDFIWLQKGSLEKAKKDGWRQGKAEGKTEVARIMKNRNMDIQVTADLTGLTIQEIQNIIEQYCVAAVAGRGDEPASCHSERIE
ncbi:MAG: hypothetical protein BWK80_10155 [Desulfobacteraceae bacterium IS3]|nr:MAG: hypothetical protein BWK80_10155 [Desulfobacteraceae bacterium IS3]